MTQLKKFQIELLLLFVTISSIAQTKESNYHYYKGIKYVEANNYLNAVEEFKTCLKIDTVATLSFNLSNNSHDWIAYCYFKLGKTDSARYYSDFHKYRPYNRFEIEGVDSLYGKGIEYSNKKDYRKALECVNGVEQLLAMTYDSNNMYLNKIWVEQAKLQYVLNHHPSAINILTKVWYNYNDSLGPCKNWKEVGDLLLKCYYDEGKKQNFLQSERLDSNTVIIKRTDTNKRGLFYIGKNSDLTLILPMEYISLSKIDDRFLLVNKNWDKYFVVDFSNGKYSKYFNYASGLKYICDSKGVPVFMGYGTIIGFDGTAIEYPRPLLCYGLKGDSVGFEIDSIKFSVHKDSILKSANTVQNIFPETKGTRFSNYQVLEIFDKNHVSVYTNNKTDELGLFRIVGDIIEEILPVEYRQISQFFDKKHLFVTNGSNQYIIDLLSHQITMLKYKVDESDVYWNEDDPILNIEYNKKKLFYCGNYRKMFIDTEGNVYHLPIGVDLEKSGNTYYCKHYKYNLSIPLSKFPLGRTSEYRIKDHDQSIPNWRFSVRMDYPLDNSLLSMNVRNWMSETLGNEAIFCANETDNPKRMYRHYAHESADDFYLQSTEEKEDIVNHRFIQDADIYRLWEDSLYVTYISGYTWDYGGPHGDGNTQLVTFNKCTSKKVTLRSLFDDKDTLMLHNKLYNIIKKELIKRSGEDDIEMEYTPQNCPLGEVALTPDGIVFQYNAYELAAYSMGSFDFTIPYKELVNANKLPPMSPSAKNVFIESLKKANSFRENILYDKKQESISNIIQCDSIRQLLGANSGEYLNSIIKLSKSFQGSDLFEDATYFAEHYVNLVKKYAGTESEAYRFGLENLIDCYLKSGQYQNVLSKCFQLLELYENEYFLNESKYANKFSSLYLKLASAYWKLEVQDSAFYYQEKYLQNSMSSEIEDVMTAAEYASACLQTHKALKYAQQVFSHNWDYDNPTSTWQEKILNRFKKTKSKERTNLRNKYISWFQSFLPQLAASSQDSAMIKKAYDALLLSKNILLNVEQSMRNMILSSQDTTIITPYLELQEKKQQLIRYTEIKEPELRDELVNRVTNGIESLEKELGEKSKVYGNYTKQLQLNINDVRRHLHSDEIAIEFANCSDNNYYALVLSPMKATPIVIKLCTSSEIQEQSANLYKLIWEPILSYTNGTRSIFFSPAGEIFSRPIEYATDSDGRYVNELYRTYRVSSTREIAIARDSSFIDASDSSNNAVLYGYLDYYADNLYMSKRGKGEIPNGDIYSIKTNFMRTGSLRSNVERLKYTNKEIDEICSLLSTSQYAKVESIYKNETGTESSLKDYSGSHIKLLHLATHGFYITKSEMENFKNLNFLTLDSLSVGDIEDKELVRSGLLFAGANHTLEGDGVIPEGVDDGILTSLEVASLDLLGLDLVVLSACQTAQGDLTDDGVMGLQRGFKKAGAHSLLMSLWKVEDEATQILMTQFYKNLTSGMSKRESLMSAQKYLRAYDSGNYNKPEYWAAFILLDGIN